MDFKEQYKHPNWQKKRLEVLEDAEFTCERCFDAESQLHVHHKRYVKGRKVWEYDRSELTVLCDSCHHEVHAEKEVIQSLICAIPVDSIPEITALIAHYCLSVEGPCRGADFTGYIDATHDDPFASAVGKAAAIISNRCTIYSINDLAERLTVAAPGAAVEIRAKNRSVFTDDVEF